MQVAAIQHRALQQRHAVVADSMSHSTEQRGWHQHHDSALPSPAACSSPPWPSQASVPQAQAAAHAPLPAFRMELPDAPGSTAAVAAGLGSAEQDAELPLPLAAVVDTCVMRGILAQYQCTSRACLRCAVDTAHWGRRPHATNLFA